MPTEFSRNDARTEFTVDNDDRLMVGVFTIVEHAAHHAGFAHDAQAALAATVVEACKETFPLLNGSESALKVAVEPFHDRVEITIEHSGEPLPTAGLDTFVPGATPSGSGLGTALLSTKVDRVKYETHEGRSRTILIKYRAGGAPKDVL